MLREALTCRSMLARRQDSSDNPSVLKWYCDTDAVEIPTIRCSNCGTELYDPPEAIMVDGRPPCPACGATERTYVLTVEAGGIRWAGGQVDATVHPATVEATASVPTPAIEVSVPSRRSLDELATHATARTILWHDPNEHGDVLCEVRNEDGTVLGVSVGSDLDDAILNLLDELKPPRE